MVLGSARSGQADSSSPRQGELQLLTWLWGDRVTPQSSSRPLDTPFSGTLCQCALSSTVMPASIDCRVVMASLCRHCYCPRAEAVPVPHKLLAPTPPQELHSRWWWELVAHCCHEVAQRSCSGGRTSSSAVLAAGEPAAERREGCMSRVIHASCE